MIKSVDGGTTNTSESDVDGRAGYLSFSLLGRYPFALGPVSIFPLLGMEYDLNLYYQDIDGNDLKARFPDQEKADLNQFWFKAGVAADIALYKGLSARSQALLGFKLLNQGEKADLQDAIDNYGATTARMTEFVFKGGVQAGWRFQPPNHPFSGHTSPLDEALVEGIVLGSRQLRECEVVFFRPAARHGRPDQYVPRTRAVSTIAR